MPKAKFIGLTAVINVVLPTERSDLLWKLLTGFSSSTVSELKFLSKVST